MNEIKVLIVDDEAPARRRMAKLLSSQKGFSLIGQAENGEEAIEFINDLKPDLLLLDIQLKDMTGFDVLKKIQKEIYCSIIFITAYDQFAIDAFEANALDYLLKPYKDERFFRAIKKTISLIETKSKPSLQDITFLMEKFNERRTKIKVNEGKVTHFINTDDLVYVKSESYYCNFYSMSNAKPKVIRISLKKLEASIPDYFVRINKSVIVNTKKISAIRVLKNEIELGLEGGADFVAKRSYKGLEEKILHFM